MTAAYDIRIALLHNGYAPLPCDRETKRPVVSGWPDITVTPELIDSWDIQFPTAQNHGLRLEGLDLDISDEEVCRDLEKEIFDWFDGSGEALIRFGNPPRRLIPFRVTGELTKVSRTFKDPAGNEQGLELLGARSQFIAYGTHPKGHAYAWFRDRGPLEVPASELPQLSADEARQLFGHLCAVLEQRHSYVELIKAAKVNGHAAGTNDDERIRVDAEVELAAMTPGNVNDVQIRVIPSLLWRGLNPNDVVSQVTAATMDMAKRHGLTEWTEQAEVIKHVRPRVGSALKNLFLKDYDPATGTIPSWLCADFHKAWMEKLAAGLSPRFGCGINGFFVRGYGCGSDDASGDHADTEHNGNDDSATHRAAADEAKQKKRSNTVVLRPFVPLDPATFPPRQWLYGRHYLRRTVSCTTAPGGFGKSSVDMVEAIAMATCRPLLSEQPTERLRVWYHNGEDNYEELSRRILAICQNYNIPQEELVGWFFMTSGNEFPLRVAAGYNSLAPNEALIAQIKKQIEDNEIDLAIFDPLISLHGVSENDNVKMSQVLQIFAEMADTYNCSIEICHHTRKPLNGNGGHDYDALDTRGAGSIHDAVRALRVFNRMSEHEAGELSIPSHERASYFRVDRGKGNYSPAAQAVWRRFINVTLPNGDDVGVVSPWLYPGQGESSPERDQLEQAAEYVFMRLLNRFTLSGETVSSKSRGNYAPRIFAKENEAKLAKLNVIQLERAMRRLFEKGKIKSEQIDKRGVYRIVPV